MSPGKIGEELYPKFHNLGRISIPKNEWQRAGGARPSSFGIQVLDFHVLTNSRKVVMRGPCRLEGRLGRGN